MNHRLHLALVKLMELAGFTLVLASTAAGVEKPVIECSWGLGKQKTHQVDGYLVRVEPVEGDQTLLFRRLDFGEFLKLPAARCRAVVLAPTGAQVFETTASSVFLESVSEKDINGDGEPDLVIYGSNDTPSHHYIYSIISLGKSPRVLAQIRNEYGLWFKKLGRNGRIYILTADGAFQGLEDLLDVYHYDLVVPEVILELRGSQLIDVSASFPGEYDLVILQAKGKLNTGTIQRFRDGRISNSFYRGLVKGRILSIVFSYLYSGREEKAWQQLDRMWPAKDKERIKSAILEARSRGILSRLSRALAPPE